MTDIDGLTCEQLREAGAELALGVLPARERAAAVAHLQHCPACREQVRELALVADGLIDLVPCSEPPVGFESRVLQRMGLPSQWQRHRRVLWRRFALAAAAAVAAFAVGLGGWAIGGSSGHPAPSVTTAPAKSAGYALLTAGLTAGGRPVGEAFAYTGPSPWVYMSVDAEVAGNSLVRCQLQRRDGSAVTIGSFRLTGGYGSWGAPYPAGPSPVTGVRLLAGDGRLLATGRFLTADR